MIQLLLIQELATLQFAEFGFKEKNLDEKFVLKSDDFFVFRVTRGLVCFSGAEPKKDFPLDSGMCGGNWIRVPNELLSLEVTS